MRISSPQFVTEPLQDDVSEVDHVGRRLDRVATRRHFVDIVTGEGLTVAVGGHALDVESGSNLYICYALSVTDVERDDIEQAAC